jgi:branched-chain amino acid transport system substrate-binding protein
VARDELAGGSVPIRLTYDSTVASTLADVEVDRAQRLVTIPGLVAVVGHGNSRGSLAAAPVYNEAGISQVAPTSTSRRLGSAGPWTFALPPNDSIEGAFIGDYVAGELGARSATIYYVNDEYGVGLRDGVKTRLRQRGVVVLDEVSVDPLSDFATVVEASLRRGVPEAVVVAARTPETGAIARLMRARVPSIQVVAGDGALQLPALVTQVGDAAPALHVVSFWMADATDSLSRAFVERFRRIAGSEPIGTDAMMHDAIMVLAAAVRDVGRRPMAIRRYLESLGRERPPYQGVTGPVSFQPGRAGNFMMTRLEGNRIVRVEPR